MMRKIVLFVSAFVPMYILFLINLIVELLNENLTLNLLNTIVLSGLIILIFMGICGLLITINFDGEDYEEVYIINKQNITDQHFLNYFSLFVLLALTFDLSKVCFLCVFIVILIFIGVVYIRNNIFYVNPLLNILGYSFYDIVYKDANNNKCEKRIFYKGELKVGDFKYKLYKSNRNLNFLDKN